MLLFCVWHNWKGAKPGSYTAVIKQREGRRCHCPSWHHKKLISWILYKHIHFEKWQKQRKHWTFRERFAETLENVVNFAQQGTFRFFILSYKHVVKWFNIPFFVSAWPWKQTCCCCLMSNDRLVKLCRGYGKVSEFYWRAATLLLGQYMLQQTGVWQKANAKTCRRICFSARR